MRALIEPCSGSSSSRRSWSDSARAGLAGWIWLALLRLPGQVLEQGPKLLGDLGPNDWTEDRPERTFDLDGLADLGLAALSRLDPAVVVGSRASHQLRLQ